MLSLELSEGSPVALAMLLRNVTPVYYDDCSTANGSGIFIIGLEGPSAFETVVVSSLRTQCGEELNGQHYSILCSRHR